MECNERDVLDFLEGNAGEEVKAHISGCRECTEAVAELSVYRKVLPYYQEGKRLWEDLDEHMKSFDEQEVKHLPPAIEEMLRQARKEGAGQRESTVKPFRRPGKEEWKTASNEAPLAAAAIPRDLTKPKKRKSKEEGEDKEKK